MVPRGRMYRGPARNIADANMAAGVGSGMLPVPYGMAGVGGLLPLDAAASIPQPMPITALASALDNASPDQQRTMLGENLYPLVDQLEHEHAAKVTGMLLEMDQTEVLHLLESPDALKEKVAEAGVMDMAAAMNLLPDSPMSSGFSQQMSPSGNGGQHSSVAWPQPNVPTLHLPGRNVQSSRLRSSLSARDIPLEDLSLLQDYESQQLLNDFTCYSVSDIAFEKWHIGPVSDIAFELWLFDLYGLQGTFST
ncbi:putative polyadenylate-binding protein/Hyperplastic disc protein [Helianthus annuus]|nr:putative polyadenylate-binding protein/Hyperplastic disc protein [Helianthus annuus]